MTRYISTRGQVPPAGFTDAMMAGLADDGGLYVPQSFPHLTADDCAQIAGLGYADAAARVLGLLIGSDIPSADLADMTHRAYASFEHADIAPLVELEDRHFLLELYHGPTLAFKDIALQFLGQAFTRALAANGRRITIVGATSGDTGSAAIAAFAGKPGVEIVILHPKGRIADVQRRQMTTVAAANVHNIAIEGSFDDCQNMVKAMFADAGFREETNLSAINSINWARIAAQVVYYVTTALKVQAQTGQAPAFVVPTGNFGNIYAGYVARRMGAPVGRLIAATNRNDIIHRFFSTGTMQRHMVEPSLSPSMDIQVASNFERLLFDQVDHRGDVVDAAMKRFTAHGTLCLEPPVLERMREVFSSGRCDDAQTLATIADVAATSGRLIDPHTAVGVHVARAWRQLHPGQPVVTLATAHAAKFPEAVLRATGRVPEVPAQLRGILDKAERCTTLPVDRSAIQEHIRNICRRG